LFDFGFFWDFFLVLFFRLNNKFDFGFFGIFFLFFFFVYGTPSGYGMPFGGQQPKRTFTPAPERALGAQIRDFRSVALNGSIELWC